VREIARELGVSENYLTKAIPERAPKKNYKLLKVTRLLYQEQLARECIAKKLSAREAAQMANITLRTMYRRIEYVLSKTKPRT
jgi:hypothetical protein